MVSFKLPFTVKKLSAGEIRVQKSKSILSNLLYSASKKANGVQTTWIGWPGHVNLEDQEKVTKELAKVNCIPIYLNLQTVQ